MDIDGSIIAERKLQLETGDNAVADIYVRLYQPYPEMINDMENWRCRFEIVGLDQDKPIGYAISGMDALDAIENSTRFVNNSLDYLKNKYVGKISWLLRDELADGGPLRGGAIYGDASWQTTREKARAAG